MTTMTPRPRAGPWAARRTAFSRLAGPSGPASVGLRMAPVTTTGASRPRMRSSTKAVSSIVSGAVGDRPRRGRLAPPPARWRPASAKRSGIVTAGLGSRRKVLRLDARDLGELRHGLHQRVGSQRGRDAARTLPGHGDGPAHGEDGDFRQHGALLGWAGGTRVRGTRRRPITFRRRSLGQATLNP